MRNSKVTKVFSWYYIFAFLAIFGLGVYLYSSFRIREGAAGDKFALKEKVLVLWSKDNKYYPAKIGSVMGGDKFFIQYTADNTGDEVDATLIEKMPDNVVKFAAMKCVDNTFLLDWNKDNIKIPTPESEKDLQTAMDFQSNCK